MDLGRSCWRPQGRSRPEMDWRIEPRGQPSQVSNPRGSDTRYALRATNRPLLSANIAQDCNQIGRQPAVYRSIHRGRVMAADGDSERTAHIARCANHDRALPIRGYRTVRKAHDG